MNIKKLLTKYSILLLFYIALTRFVQPYGLHLYYTLHPQPDMLAENVRTIQSIITSVSFLINLIFVVFVVIDSKKKKALDWLIVAITFFSAEIGITLFLIWQIYKEIKEKAQQNA